jgi:5-(carboxyamino)imidazole ribonucleotide synthase
MDSRQRRAPAGSRVVGIVGAGQLARMLCEAASALDIGVVVLAEHPDDAAALVAPSVVLGTPSDPSAMRAIAERADVITFDHEQVDLDVLATLEAEGTVVRPGLPTLEMAVDKSVMRARLDAAGLPVPAYEALDRESASDPEAATAAVVSFADRHGWPVVVKAARGGYDGKGVWPVPDTNAARALFEATAGAAPPILLEAFVPIDAELAVVVARRPSGETVAWPPVETAQVDGVCREVLFPCRLDPAVAERAAEVGRKVAEVAESVGVLAVELFLAGDELVVNEVAARPHNSAHWTIEGSVTSQFENHMRAVLDLPLGSTAPAAAVVASVNVFGAPPPGAGDVAVATPDGALPRALAVEGAHVHLYGKAPRPGRKLGHVTVCGNDPSDVRARAWAAARTLGTPLPAMLDVGLGR